MIEIRELVIRANVEDSSRENAEKKRGQVGSDSAGTETCSEAIDVILQIIKDKKER